MAKLFIVMSKDTVGRETRTYEELATALEEAAWANPALSDRQKHVVLLAESAAVASRDPEAVARHVEALLELGCSADEIVEVGELASVLPIHACTEGMPVLAEVVGRSSADIAADFGAEQQRVRRAFESSRGYWSEFWTVLLSYDQAFFSAYADLSARPWEGGVLEPYERELVYLGFDASPQHLYRPGMAIHAENALRLGATEAQVASVFILLGVADVTAYRLVEAEVKRRRRG